MGLFLKIDKIDRSEHVRHDTGGIRDDERVARIGPGLAPIEISDPPHRQPGQMGDRAPHVPGRTISRGCGKEGGGRRVVGG